MIARLAKGPSTVHGRRAMVGAIQEDARELWVAEASTVGIAPPEPAGNEVDRLYAALEAVSPQDHPRTARLLGSSTRKVAQKVIEEAGEVALATVKHNKSGIVHESADLLYHLTVLWRRTGIGADDVWAEMRRRAESLGIAEKRPKSKT
jgi:phosphoribosyl-ATP pyrophosphohydrolase